MAEITTWTDELPEEIIEVMVAQIFGEYFEHSVYANGMKHHFTEYEEHGSCWTWEEEE